MYSHRVNSNLSRTYERGSIIVEPTFTLVEEFVLPREEARQLFRSYNHVWNLQIDEHQIQRACDSCARNGLVRIDDALKQLAR